MGVGGSPRPRLASWSPPPSLLGAWPRLCLALPAHGCAPAPAHLAVPRHLMSGARDPLFAGLSCVPLWMTHSTLAECPKNCTDSVAGDRTGSCLDPSLSVSPDPTPNYLALGIQLLRGHHLPTSPLSTLQVPGAPRSHLQSPLPGSLTLRWFSQFISQAYQCEPLKS